MSDSVLVKYLPTTNPVLTNITSQSNFSARVDSTNCRKYLYAKKYPIISASSDIALPSVATEVKIPVVQVRAHNLSLDVSEKIKSGKSPKMGGRLENREKMESGKSICSLSESQLLQPQSIYSVEKSPNTPYQVHNRVMGWKITTAARRKGILRQLEVMNTGPLAEAVLLDNSVIDPRLHAGTAEVSVGPDENADCRTRRETCHVFDKGARVQYSSLPHSAARKHTRPFSADWSARRQLAIRQLESWEDNVKTCIDICTKTVLFSLNCSNFVAVYPVANEF